MAHSDSNNLTNKLTVSDKLVGYAKHLLLQRGAAKPVAETSQTTAPDSLSEALTVQQIMAEMHQHPVVGWKCLTPRDDGSLIVAPLLGESVVEQTICPIAPVNNQALIEPEIAFVLAEDLPSGKVYSEAEIDKAVGETRMALELIQPRFTKDYPANHFERLADGLSNQGLYLGPEIEKYLAYSASNIALSLQQGEQQQNVVGEHPCDLPQNPLYWLVNHLSERGISLQAGQAIITGSYYGVVKMALDVPLKLEYGGLGRFDVTFIAR